MDTKLTSKQKDILGWLYTFHDNPQTIPSFFWMMRDWHEDCEFEGPWDWGWKDYTFEGLYNSLVRLEKRGLVGRRQVGSGGRYTPKYVWFATPEGAAIAWDLGFGDGPPS